MRLGAGSAASPVSPRSPTSRLRAVAAARKRPPRASMRRSGSPSAERMSMPAPAHGKLTVPSAIVYVESMGRSKFYRMQSM